MLRHSTNTPYAVGAAWLLVASLLALTPLAARGQSIAYPPEPEAMERLTEDANRGKMKAQRMLGDIWSSENNHRRDFDEAVKWYSAAAAQDSPKAQYRLGQIYQSGTGVLQDRGEALRWFTKASEQGDAKAMVELGKLYYIGDGVKKDYVLAHFWFNVATKEGSNVGELKRNIMATGMSPAQIAKAERMARDWHPKRPPKCVLDESCLPMQFKQAGQ